MELSLNSWSAQYDMNTKMLPSANWICQTKLGICVERIPMNEPLDEVIL